MRAETEIVENTSIFWNRSWTTVKAALLAVVLATVLAACGENESGGAETETIEYGSYDEWDANGNNEIDDREFRGSIRESWDEDGNGYIDGDEFDTGVNAYYDDYDYSKYGDYDDWDADNNEEIDENEFDESMVDTGIYDNWDANEDDLIDEDEFSEQTS